MKVLIDSVDTYLPTFTGIVNSSIRNNTFPEELKLTEMTRLFKKVESFDQVNYRLVSLLSNSSKDYERIIFNKINTFSNLLTCFRKNHKKLRSLLNMLELWKKTSHKGKSIGAIFMDLSKAFDTLNLD